MEYHLQKELDKNNMGIKFNIDQNELDINYLSYDSKLIFKNREIIQNEKLKTYKENKIINEFLDIIKNINIKLEDVILEIKEYENYLQNKEKIKLMIKIIKVIYLKLLLLIKKEQNLLMIKTTLNFLEI